MLDDLAVSQAGARARHNGGKQGFAILVVGHADNSAFVNIFMLVERCFNFGRIDVLAAGDDHVLLAIKQEHETVLVHLPDIAGMKPAIPKGGRIFFGSVQIADRYVRATHYHFTALAEGYFSAVSINNTHVDTDKRAPCCLENFVFTTLHRRDVDVLIQCRQDRRRLRQAITLLHVGCRKGIHRAANPFHRHRRRAVINPVQR